MKFNVHGGHNFKVQGASGCFSETKEDRNVKNLVIAKLQAFGHTVYDCTDEDGATQSKNLVNIVNKCNAHSVDLDISIHFNASNGAGHGVEVLVYSDNSKAKPYAQNICNSVAALGFTNRGVKIRTNLYVLKKTNAPSLLVECCFCDNQGDASLYNAEKMADAIVKGIVGKTVEVKQEVTTVSPTPTAKAKSYLSNGDKGIAVKTMQTMLIAVGYSCGKYGADSSFGTGTTNALKKFQKAYGLTVDGKYGNKSKAKLESVYNAKTTQTTKKSNDDWVNRLNAEIKVQGFSTYPLVKRGAKGNITKLIQERLVSVGFSLKIDGDFGETTEAKVKKFQSNRGLKADGKVGQKTWEWLISGKSV